MYSSGRTFKVFAQNVTDGVANPVQHHCLEPKAYALGFLPVFLDGHYEPIPLFIFP